MRRCWRSRRAAPIVCVVVISQVIMQPAARFSRCCCLRATIAGGKASAARLLRCQSWRRLTWSYLSKSQVHPTAYARGAWTDPPVGFGPSAEQSCSPPPPPVLPVGCLLQQG